MRIRSMMMVVGFSVAGLVAAVGWSSSRVRTPSADAQPRPGDETTAPPPAADFAELLASGGVPCHSPKRCCEFHPSGDGKCLSLAQCTAGPCP